VFTIDAISLPRLQEAGFEAVIGSRTTQQWDPTLDNAANERFVTDYKAKFGEYPSYYAAQSYDAIMLIASAVEAVDGNMEDKDAVREALRAAEFDSVRGEFRFGPNHLPIQDFYLREVIVDEDGAWTTKVVQTVFEDHQDSYAEQCNM
jgi:branched-chain amino acid transport system substrate-binding protein